MKRISDDIDNICINLCDGFEGRCQRYPRIARSCEDFRKFEAGVDAQLQQDQKEHDRIVREIKEGIEQHLQCGSEGQLVIAVGEDSHLGYKVYGWWQSFWEKWV